MVDPTSRKSKKHNSNANQGLDLNALSKGANFKEMLDKQKLKEQLIKEAETEKFKNYIKNSSHNLFSLIYRSIRSEYSADELHKNDIQKIELLFQSCQRLTGDELDDLQKASNVVNSIHQELIKIVEDSQKDLPNIDKQQHKNLTLQQLDDALKANAQKGVFDRLNSFVEDKTGGINLKKPGSLPKFLMKKFGGDGNKDTTMAVDDAAIAMDAIGIFGSARKTILGDKLFASLLGGSMIVGLGYLVFPLVPIIVARKAIPSSIIPVLGGLTVDSIVAEKTVLNPIDKNTVRVGCPPLAQVFVDDNQQSQSLQAQGNALKDNFSITSGGDSNPDPYKQILDGKGDLLSAFTFEPPHTSTPKKNAPSSGPDNTQQSVNFARKLQANIGHILQNEERKRQFTEIIEKGEYKNQEQFSQVLYAVCSEPLTTKEVEQLTTIIDNTKDSGIEKMLGVMSQLTETAFAGFIDAKLGQSQKAKTTCHADTLTEQRERNGREEPIASK